MWKKVAVVGGCVVGALASGTIGYFVGRAKSQKDLEFMKKEIEHLRTNGVRPEARA